MSQERDSNLKFISDANQYLIEQKDKEITKYSAEEYFLWLLSQGIAARLKGNYGIAAAFVARIQKMEIIFFGQNTVITERDPFGHAEMNAVKSAVNLLKLPNKKRETYLKNKQLNGEIIVRSNPHDHTETILYTTLEPCPMCTAGAVINSGLQHVVIGTPDAYGGQLEESRFKLLPPVWKETADSHNLTVDFAQSTTSSEKDTYVPVQLLTMLNDLFFQTKEELDLKIATEPCLETKSLATLKISDLN